MPATADKASTESDPTRPWGMRLVGYLAAFLVLGGSLAYVVANTGTSADPDRDRADDASADQPAAPEDDPAGAETDTGADAESGSPTEPPDDAEVTVAESGFSAVPDSTGQPQVSWGLILENTSEEAAATATVEIDVVDEDGDSLVAESYEHDRNMAELLRPSIGDLVAPGEQTGLGDFVLLDDDEVAEVTFDVVEMRWWEPDSAPDTTEQEVGEVVGDHSGGELELEFTVHSQRQQELEAPSAQAVFRETGEDGAIVGGSRSLDFAAEYAFPRGESTHRATIRDGLPAELAADAVEVYIYSARV